MTEPSDENKVTADAETQAARSTRTRPPRRLKFNFVLLGLLVLIVGASVAGVMLFRQAAPSTETGESAPAVTAQGPLASHATGALTKLETHAAPRPIEDISFVDGDGKPVKLSDFKGRVVVLNIWATWCAPCRVEMPTLANLQKAYDPAKVIVLALSIDEAAKLAEAKAFIDMHEPLALYNDPEVQPLSKWGVVGMPTTIIIDTSGQEVARLSGEADWDAPGVKALIDAVAQ